MKDERRVVRRFIAVRTRNELRDYEPGKSYINNVSENKIVSTVGLSSTNSAKVRFQTSEVLETSEVWLYDKTLT